MRAVLAVLILAAFALGASLSFYNWAPVHFDYLAGETDLPLIALLLGAFALGVATVGVLDAARRFSNRQELRRRDRQIRELEAELKSLRGLPLDGGATRPGVPRA